MANKMLIDASHPEETRVVVVRGSRIEEFDFESEHKKQLKGNIYLAKVTRVEPSLQAAFVEYGGNRHGFLAFSEIHPDYYQIPKADREALLAEEMARGDEDDDADEPKPKPSARSGRGRGKPRSKAADREDAETISEAVTVEDDAVAPRDDDAAAPRESVVDADAAEAMGDDDTGLTVGSGDSDAEAGDGEAVEASDTGDDAGSPRKSRRSRRSRSRAKEADADGDDDDSEPEEIDEIGSEDAMEEVPVRQARPRKQYKIQEVIKRRQILLVQVVKEERGNKGAALTTYLSLAGRYSVLMPNTARGGGISRKITNAADRKRLKEVVRDLEVPRGMGIILRTAGANRTKAEVKRDYEYLMRLWETVRTVTLSSIAPALVYEEGSLIKRSIRDLYNKDIDQILVAGDGGYREAKDFMRMLMPSQAKVVQPYRDPTPIFARQGIEGQLDKMLQPHVTLKSGGYIIINQTEALVAIDVNSGRSTKEHSIEDTAFQTNLEAAEEVARQLRLRDLAGLIVIDFIDMEEKRNNRSVEKKLKDCLKNDRARIQVGKISHFGLLEMSRQRIRASVLESTMQPCPTCGGTGHIRSSSSLALHVLRNIEEHLQKHANHDLIVKVPTATALYVLNEKRKRIDEIEQHYGLRVTIEADETAGHQAVAIEHGALAEQPILRAAIATPESVAADDEIEAEAIEVDAPSLDEQKDESGDGNGKRRRRRRRKRRGDRGGESDETASQDQPFDESAESDDADGADSPDETDTAEDASDDNDEGDGDNGDRGSRRRRRGRRGGRRHREDGSEAEGQADEPSEDTVAAKAAQPDADTSADDAETVVAASEAVVVEDGVTAAAPSDGDEKGETETLVPAPEAVSVPIVSADDAAAGEAPTAPADEPSSDVEAGSDAAEEIAPGTAGADAPDEQPAANDDTPVPAERKDPVVTSSTGADAPEDGEGKPRRTGWWARRSFF
ncbi:Rne/Rng family ribonuclease [Jiella sp. MQZ9-1]|uniref:Ribonuclease E n=1 Tax=Jiella flava TaxID=2816857 RepID=A0A939G0K3_9HYPH|nr:Rne/Rng family ribonuclease [Jiella flava]MBO0662849.1 Rne/Rng family ribonuclease [Jiella flava]MCD2471391.1 Rne/Rng family ribonuclease [Jiella flava]